MLCPRESVSLLSREVVDKSVGYKVKTSLSPCSVSGLRLGLGLEANG